jgi:hypothetical protein
MVPGVSAARGGWYRACAGRPCGGTRGIGEISAARGAMRWLREFDYVQAVAGNVRSCNGIPVLIDHGSLSRNDNPTNANRLLGLLEQIR